MANFVGGYNITPEYALKGDKHINKLNHGHCEFYRYAYTKNGELFVYGMHISPYEKGNIFNKDPLRTRKLLMHRREIDRLFGKMKIDGYTLIPLKAYFKNGYVKIEVALCKGKKLHDKREDAAIKDMNRAIDRATKNRGE